MKNIFLLILLLSKLVFADQFSAIKMTVEELQSNELDESSDESKSEMPFHRVLDPNKKMEQSESQTKVKAQSNQLGAPSPAASKNFTAVTSDDTINFPPDTMGAVGPTQFIVCINGRIKSFNKSTGAADGVMNSTLSSFFSSVLSSGFRAGDPRIRYDRFTNRWFVIAAGFPSNSDPSSMLIAVSEDDVITNSTIWNFYSFIPKDITPTSAVTGYLGDYPTLGIDTHALYIGVDVFDANDYFVDSEAFVIKKSDLITDTLTVHAFRDLITPSGGPVTPQGVDNFDDDPEYGYFIGVDAVYYDKLVYRKITNPGSTPTISDNISINIPSTSASNSVPHKGNTGGVNGYLDGLDDRLMCAHIRNNKLYTVHNFAVTNLGAASFSSSDADGCRWYQIDASNPDSFSVLQSGTVFNANSTSTNRKNYWIPSIMTNGLESVLLGFSSAGANFYANAAHVLRYKTDPNNTMRTPIQDTSSTTSYNPSWDNGAGRGCRRWGDYSYTSLDPLDNMTMWSIQEFCSSTNKFGCRVFSIRAAPPAALTTCTPSSVTKSNTNVNFVIKGSSSNGTAFYDPPIDFEKHLQVAIGDLQIISFTVVSPTQINVTANAQNATKGRKTITITNPDGQVVSKSRMVTVR